MSFGGFRSVWILAMFDLPTDTKSARKAYHDFREFLVDDGFMMLQYSVYGRHCASEENAEVHQTRVQEHLPPDGEVRIVVLTDKQFERMKVFHGKVRAATEPAPEQLSIF
jgi:CRISPR-associated protein Cas2